MFYLAAVTAATAFNLVCSGTLQSESFFAGKKSEPYSYTYRIDLAQKKWCEGGCDSLRDIAVIQPAYLVLEPDQDIDTPSKHEFYRSSINRLTGHESTLSTSGRGSGILIMKWQGQCEKQPFTGFPSFQTKF